MFDSEKGVEEVVIYECAGCGDHIYANERYFELAHEEVHFNSECATLYMISNYVIKLAGEGME